MKKYISLLLIVGGLLANLISASSVGASWWDKGASMLDSFNSGSKSKMSPATVTGDEISAAFKEALNIGAVNVVQQLGRVDGFNADPSIHIPLPTELNIVKDLLGKVGMAGMVDDLEMKLNRAAEKATPKAKELFLESIGAMTFDDVMAIYNGSDDSATKYFRQKMSPSLRKEMLPTIEQTLSQVGVVQVYDNMMDSYKDIPFVPDVKADLTEHVLSKGLDGIFFYMAKEEMEIRQNPVKQTSKLLKKVFGVGL